MAGVILENISTKKLVLICLFLFSLSLSCFIIGGAKAPKAVHTQTVIGTWCKREWNGTKERQWYSSSGEDRCSVYPHNAKHDDVEDQVTASDIAFSFQYPLVRDNTQLKMSRWFAYHTTVLSFDITRTKDNNPENGAAVDFIVKVGYRNGNSSWSLLYKQEVSRKLICHTEPQEIGYRYDCEFMDFFEIGNMHHEQYLINIRLPPNPRTGSNTKIGKLEGIELVWFAQTGGFTLYLLVLKTVCFALLLPLTIWNWKRVVDLNRSPVFLEKLLLALAVSAIILNLPIDWLMLVIEMKFMLLWSDIRQGVFLSILLTYWLVFTGEHVVDDVKRGSWISYWKQVATVILASSLMFIFDICERGVRIVNPFFSLWATRQGILLGKAFIGIAIAASIVYSLILVVLIIKAIYNIWTKRAQFKSMAKGLRIHYMSVIYRFFFALTFSAVSCLLTVTAFAMGQVYESKWKWDLDSDDFDHEPITGDSEGTTEPSGYSIATSMKGFEINTAFQLGVYATWNVYVMAMLIFYAPSHKRPAHNVSVVGDNEHENDEQVELTRIDPSASRRRRTPAAASIEQTDEFCDETVNLTSGRSVITEGVSQMHTLPTNTTAD